jgi:hypothetical protein
MAWHFASAMTGKKIIRGDRDIESTSVQAIGGFDSGIGRSNESKASNTRAVCWNRLKA